VGACNTILIGTKNPIMIDPGESVLNQFKSLQNRMKNDGLDLSKISKMLFTHVHFDHANAAKMVQDLSQCTIHTHPRDIESIEKPHTEYERIIQPIIDLNIYPKVPLEWAKFFTELTIGKRNPAKTSEFLKDHQQITHEDLLIEVIYTPGHTPGHIGYYIHEYKTFIAGDIIDREMYGILNSGGCINNLEFSWEDHFRTLQLLADLDIEIYIPGHGEPIIGKKEVQTFIQHNTEISFNKPNQILTHIKPEGSDMKMILKKIYPKLPLAQLLIRKIEIYLILKQLEHLHKIENKLIGKKTKWVPISN
jgi:glyoxylase-like metal-dependent hydrolase (beta-lactamase superfamily II)